MIKKKTTDSLIEKYSESNSSRVMLQLIPYIGTPIDTFIAGKGAQIQKSRIDDYLETITNRLNKIERKVELEPSEELFDFMNMSFECVVRTRSKEKRDHFASILVNQVSGDFKWEDAEFAFRILSSVEEVHLKILKSITEARQFNGKRLVRLRSNGQRLAGEILPDSLTSLFPKLSLDKLTLICSELIAKGLITDEGIGHLSGGAMDCFVPTELADWFLEWVADQESE
ncbi:hypothetical protein [Marinicellulosiphila megalodicopiae]|uniref:hypothetical protein n=1 Tax=Marinicellulosiphila megalodicopiae TaxID=2724896 RepID=UPI003BB20359